MSMVLCRAHGSAERRAACTIFQYLKDIQVVLSLKKSLVRYSERALYVTRRFRICLEGRRAQGRELRRRFDAAKIKIVQSLPGLKKQLAGKKGTE